MIVTRGDRIRKLFSEARNSVAIITPFIKVNALHSILDVVSPDVHIRCVTRWVPEEVASGVSDPAIIYDLQERGNYDLTLVDNLHAKVYIADNRCLAGSANTTNRGLGNVDESNIEILLESTIDNPEVVSVLSEIEKVEREATTELAEKIMTLATSLPQPGQEKVNTEYWFPRSNKPENAFSIYSSSSDNYLSEVDKILNCDLEQANVPLGLSEQEFRFEIRSLLSEIPVADALLDVTTDITLTRADVHPQLSLLTTEEYSVNDLWRSFVNWMVYFFPDKVMRQEISEIALRRARLIK